MGWRDAPEVAPAGSGKGWRSAPEVGAAPAASPLQTEAAPTGIEGLWRGLSEGLSPTLHGGRQGFTFGQSANVDGLIQALGERYLPESLGGGGRSSLAESFARNKGTTERGNDAAYEAHPWLYAGGNAAATLATLGLGGGNALRGLEAPPLIRAAQVGGEGTSLAKLASAASNATGRGFAPAATLGQLAKAGSLSGLKWGAAAGVGNGLEDLLQGNLGRFAGDVALNAIPGGILGGALGPVPRLLSGLAGPLQNFAARQAVKAAGPLKSDILQLLATGRLESTGNKLLGSGVVPNGAAIEEIANRAAQTADSRGADVHSILGELDALRPPPSALPGLQPTMLSDVATGALTKLPPALEGRGPGDFPGAADLARLEGTVSQRAPGAVSATVPAAAGGVPGFNPVQVAARVRRELLDPIRSLPSHKSLIPELEGRIQDLEGLGNRRITFQRANDIKRGYDEFLNHSKEQTPALELLKRMRGIVNDEIEQGADAAAGQAGQPDLVGRFRSAKSDYRDLRTVADFARKAVAGREAKSFFSLPDYITGIAPALGALFSGHPLAAAGGLATAAGSKLLRERGNSVAANVASGLAGRLAIPGNLADLGARRLTSWAGRSQMQRALSDLLGGANLSAQGADQAAMGAY